jgi:hypothetical protein
MPDHQPRNQDQESVPQRRGDDMGEREPLGPTEDTDPREINKPLPEEETYEDASPEAPADAEVRTEGELVGHKGPKADRSGKPGTTKTDESSGSE